MSEQTQISFKKMNEVNKHIYCFRKTKTSIAHKLTEYRENTRK